MKGKYEENVLISLKKKYSENEAIKVFHYNNEKLRELIKIKNKEIALLKEQLNLNNTRSSRENKLEKFVTKFELLTGISRANILNTKIKK